MHETIEQKIKVEAHNLGFDLAGITTIKTPPHHAAYRYWLAMGRNGHMQYLANERAIQCRADPSCILPECKSILVLAIRYPDPIKQCGTSKDLSTSNIQTPRGLIAAYAWGRDYHAVLSERMQRLVGIIERIAGRPIPHRSFTDTGPLLERDLAQCAGLGWIGKNTCLISPRLGSYLFLAEILLGLELSPDPPFSNDRCGRCTRCLQACPTGCILPDRTIDARRCLSYLTIELRGSIPDDLRPLLGQRVFGCDACQIACPWNRLALEEYDQCFAPTGHAPFPNLLEEINLNTDDYLELFRDSPIQRSRRCGYIRNVSIALGNSRDRRAIPFLIKACQDNDRIIREHAEWAIRQIERSE